MRLKLHTYANNDLYLRFDAENDTEKDLIEFLLGKMSNDKKFEATGDCFNGIFIKTGKKLQ